VDKLHLHLAPMLLGGGTPLFRAGTRQRYRQRDVRPSCHAVHLTDERLISAEQEVETGGIRSMFENAALLPIQSMGAAAGVSGRSSV
jgi:hypothetical protein